MTTLSDTDHDLESDLLCVEAFEALSFHDCHGSVALPRWPSRSAYLRALSRLASRGCVRPAIPHPAEARR
jgi:hypothetical protein